MDKHKKRVDGLSEQVNSFYEQKKPFKIYHGSTNSTRVQVFKRNEMLDTSGLNHVLKIDQAKMTALIEPNVPMDKLVKATLKYGLIPPVVMEFPGITAGGGVQGGAGESSSYKWGCFHQICNEYEMVIGDGTIVTCNPQENSDLFYGTAGSYGTLGVMTAVELRLIPAKKYVQLTYFPVKSFDAAVNRMQKEVANKPDFIDGIMFARDRGVIMVGKLSNEKNGQLTRFSRARDEWFSLDADKESRGDVFNKTIPLSDYLFRYDRGAFWVGKYAFKVFNIPFTKFWRTSLNWLLHTRKLYEALQESGISQHHVVQDLALPVETAVEFMSFVDDNLGIYPYGSVPSKQISRRPSFQVIYLHRLLST
ncbi:FAD-binding oxidoreductase [Candidatus Saccharibacteria bacterium]|nr:MAG: FAD-binding oxidoreductase [Candidatus Saccharibacteria bacterium]